MGYFISCHVEKLETSSDLLNAWHVGFPLAPFRSHCLSDPSSEPRAPARFSALTSLSPRSSTPCAALSEAVATKPHHPRSVPIVLGIPVGQ